MSSLYIIFAGNERGGAATHIVALAKAVHDAGLFPTFHFVSVGAGPLHASIVQEAGTDHVTTLSAKPARALRSLVRLMRETQSNSLWHSNGPRLNVLTYLAAKWTRRRWTTTIHSDVRNDFLASSWKSLVLTRLHSFCLRHVVGGFVGNRDFCLFLPGKHAYFVPNAVNPNPLHSSKEFYQSELKRSLNLPINCALVGIAARFDPVKDIPTIFRAVAFIDDAKVHFVLAGDGQQKSELMALAESLGIQSRVHFVGFLDDVIPFYAGLDVHVLASRSEGASPFAILEAGSCDTVNVGSDIPGIRNLIQPNVTGLCFPVGDAGALAEEIRRLIADTPLRQSMVRAFRRQILPLHTSSAMLQAYLHGYQEMGVNVEQKERA